MKKLCFLFMAFACGALIAGEELLSVSKSFEWLPVTGGTKYQFSFRAKQQGAETLEENPRLSELIFNSRSFLPWCRLKFYDADRQPLNADSPSWSIPFGQWHEVKWVFYPPRHAAYMEFEIQTGSVKGTTVSLADPRLDPAPDEQAINVNPSFRYGPYNYSGWRAFNDIGRLHKLDDGATVLETGFSAYSETFPLNEPGTYRWQMKATSYAQRGGPAFLVFLDADGKEIGRIGDRISKPKKELISHFVLPKGVERGYFLIYHSVIEELRLTRVGCEEKYKELTRKPEAN
jgi:hypothetical protein